MNWKKKGLLQTQIWAENMIVMIPDMFKFWYVSCIRIWVGLVCSFGQVSFSTEIGLTMELQPLMSGQFWPQWLPDFFWVTWAGLSLWGEEVEDCTASETGSEGHHFRFHVGIKGSVHRKNWNKYYLISTEILWVICLWFSHFRRSLRGLGTWFSFQC